MNKEAPLSDRYNPQEVESKIYSFWEENKYFAAEDISTKPPFSIILPPPNVTGFLHLGHTLDHSIQDVLIRWKRMSGFNALWLPGTDHAGIATQSVVEKKLLEKGVTRQSLGREAFLKEVWDWKKQYGDRIVSQMKKIGDSCDWDRLMFTLDDGVSSAVRKVFCDLYDKGLIYRGTRLINWSPKLESAISDLEVEHVETNGSLWHIKYALEDQSGDIKELIVATTRPETLLGDTAVAVHPDDDRYQRYIGKNVILPLTGRKIKVIADSYVDKTFGSGVVKITPAHDFNDYEMGLRHSLPMINILNKDGTLNENGDKYQGLKVQEARKRIVADLESAELLEKVVPHKLSVGHCSKTQCVVEPFLSDQWFVKTSELSTPARHTVESGTTQFIPETWTKTYIHWMNIIQDWCISRQLWWGHRIPAWYCQSCNQVHVALEAPKVCKSCSSHQLKQDEDVLDTWFSSGLWPFSTMGWPQETETQKTFYPTDVLVTGHDIIFFWVARMMMMGLEFKKDVPFRKVYIHGLIRDSRGIKMSKSLNNSIDPVEIIETHGADALRFTLLSQLSAGRDLKFSTQRLDGYRNFMNKIWNATRFSLASLSDQEDLWGKSAQVGEEDLPKTSDLSVADQWITYKLSQCIQEVNEYLKQYRFSEAAMSVYSFAWHQFCDWYLEFIKPIIYGENIEEKRATRTVLAHTLNRMLKLLHPFIPFITEELYQKLPIKSEALIIADFPTLKNDKVWLSLGDEASAFEMDVVIEVISAIRNIRGENRIKPGEKIYVYLSPSDDQGQKILLSNRKAIETLSNLRELEIGEAKTHSKCAVSLVQKGNLKIDVIIPLEGLVDIQEEIQRIQKNIEKTQKEFVSLNQRLSNKKFLENAPEDIVQQGKQQLSELQVRLDVLQKSLLHLQS